MTDHEKFSTHINNSISTSANQIILLAIVIPVANIGNSGGASHQTGIAKLNENGQSHQRQQKHPSILYLNRIITLFTYTYTQNCFGILWWRVSRLADGNGKFSNVVFYVYLTTAHSFCSTTPAFRPHALPHHLSIACRILFPMLIHHRTNAGKCR